MEQPFENLEHLLPHKRAQAVPTLAEYRAMRWPSAAPPDLTYASRDKCPGTRVVRTFGGPAIRAEQTQRGGVSPVAGSNPIPGRSTIWRTRNEENLLATTAVVALLGGAYAASAQGTKEQTGVSRDTAKQAQSCDQLSGKAREDCVKNQASKGASPGTSGGSSGGTSPGSSGKTTTGGAATQQPPNR